MDNKRSADQIYLKLDRKQHRVHHGDPLYTIDSFLLEVLSLKNDAGRNFELP